VPATGKIDGAKMMILPACFDPLEIIFSYQEVQFRMFCSPVKTNCPAAENIYGIPNSICFCLIH